MKRLLLCLWFLTGVFFLAAAPVPKQSPPPKPSKLTPELLKGNWRYEWSSMLGGYIIFDGQGGYTAQHDPASTTTYSGTVAVSDDSITITEWTFDSATGASSGPVCYRFDVDVREWPTLPGKSTGGFGFDVQQIPPATIHLKLSGKK